MEIIPPILAGFVGTIILCSLFRIWWNWTGEGITCSRECCIIAFDLKQTFYKTANGNKYCSMSCAAACGAPRPYQTHKF